MLNIEISPDVAALVEALVAVSPGQAITYAALSGAIARDVQEHRHLLASAQRIAAREHGAVFGTERNVGYTRLSVDQLHAVGSTARRHIRRTTHKAVKLINQGMSRANDIPAEVQRKVNAEISSLALLEYISGDKVSAPAPVHDQRPEPVAVTARRLFGEAAA